MPDPSLASCRSKLSQAKKHRDSLHKYLEDFFAVEGNRPRLGTKFIAESLEWKLYVNYMPDLSVPFRETGLIVGDAINNLRSVLDYVAYQLALLNNGGSLSAAQEKNVQFPLIDDPRQWPGILKGCARDIHPEHTAIIERFQPYHRFHEELAVGPYFHPFAMLRDLSNSDKHRLPTLVGIPGSGVEGSLPGMMLLFGSMAEFAEGKLPSVQTTPVELGTVLVSVRMKPGSSPPEVEMAGNVLPQVSFVDGYPVIAVLDKIGAALAIAIGEFDPFFKA